MKRYTGQKALYEAISRSRAKTQQRSILERLRPEPPKPEDPAGQDPTPQQVEPREAAVAPEQPPESVAETPTEPPVVEMPQEPADPEPQAESGPVETPPEPPVETTPAPVERVEPIVRSRPMEKIGHPAPPSSVQPWLRPRSVQLNEGRIEVSVPYYVGIIAGLAVLVIVLAAFRLGQAGASATTPDAGGMVQPAANRSGTPTNPPARPRPQDTTTGADRPQPNPATPTTTRQETAVTTTQGDHLIVLARCQRREDFEPVQRHFAESGIELDMVSLAKVRDVLAENGLGTRVASGDGFWVVVNGFFRNPETPGTDGFVMKEKVVQVGALYRGKSPPGCESFGPHYFDDAYGTKILKSQ